MSFHPNSSPPVHTPATCGACGKETTVPFVPTPGRPVFCRDCFSKQRDARGGPGGGAGGPRGPPRGGPGGRPGGGFRGGGGFNRDERPPPTARKRMLRQGSKAHFRYDLKAILESSKMDETQKLSFAETIFSKGARMSSEDAMEWVDSKVADETISAKDAQAINQLIHRYSMWR